MHKVVNVGIFVLFYIVINHLNFNLMHHDKCKVTLKFIPLVTTSNLLSLEVVERMSQSHLLTRTVEKWKRFREN